MNKEINGISVNYDIKGSGDYVFILQGWGTSLEVYASVANLLAQKLDAATSSDVQARAKEFDTRAARIVGGTTSRTGTGTPARK